MEHSNSLLKPMCRACLCRNLNFYSLYDKAEGQAFTICDMFTTTLPHIPIHKNDELPEVICTACLNTLITAHKFHEMCTSSDTYLRSLLPCKSLSICDSNKGQQPEGLKHFAVTNLDSTHQDEQPMLLGKVKIEKDIEDSLHLAKENPSALSSAIKIEKEEMENSLHSSKDCSNSGGNSQSYKGKERSSSSEDKMLVGIAPIGHETTSRLLAPKTNAERSKAYRARLKQKKPSKPPPKSSSQRGKEFRERRKQEQAASNSDSAAESTSLKKTPSQRFKQYREEIIRKQLREIEESTKHLSKNIQSEQEETDGSYMHLLQHSVLRKKSKIHVYDLSQDGSIEEYPTPINNLNTEDERGPRLDQEQKKTRIDQVYDPAQYYIIEEYETPTNNLKSEDERGPSLLYASNLLMERFSGNDEIDSDFQINESQPNEMLQPCDLDEEHSQVDEITNELVNDNYARNVNEATVENGNERSNKYSCYEKHAAAHLEFFKIFKMNSFGHSCAVCDRLWWKNDLKLSSPWHENILKDILPNFVIGSNVNICSTCKRALDKQKIPLLSVYNGFAYPTIPLHLPTLDLVSQRIISPRIPFMQMRRLRHVSGHYSIYGQTINIPIDVNTMVTTLPRNIDNDHCFNVHLKKKLIHKSSYVQGLVNKRKIKDWLHFLVGTPLYIHHNITIDNTFFEDEDMAPEINIYEISEHVPIEDNLVSQQQTLLWNEDDILFLAPGEKNLPISILFDEYAEELSFPTVYAGQFRVYKENVNVTPFMQATSELRRTDRRGVEPQHLLYLAAKIMRLRVRDSVTAAFKNVSTNNDITKVQVKDSNYLNSCIETNLAFLCCIPNSAWYWADRKKDLFAIMRQKGAPTAFMSLSCNEIGWSDLLKLLYKFKNLGADVSDEFVTELNYMKKATLINDDAVTCAIYFNKLVESLMHILMAKKKSPFGRHRVVDYFLRIEFQHQGSPHAHILLWLADVPANLLSNNPDVIDMIDQLVSVSATEASGDIKLQTHKHTFTCYEKMVPNKKPKCRFRAPFMPSKNTVTLFPMKDTDLDYSEDDFKKYQKHFKILRKNLENFNYADFTHFYRHNDIQSDEHYHNILRAGINRPKLFYKRSPSEKWYNTFNPFIFYHLKSNMDFQIIQDEFACAAYVVEYVNKTDRGISNLQRKIIEIMDENPEFDMVQITSKLSFDFVSAVEMSAQEAAWYLLRMPNAKSTLTPVYIPTIWPIERQRIRKSMRELEALDEDCGSIWKENWFDKYEKRPEEMNDANLAQFVANYFKNNSGQYVKRKEPKIIRYRNYDMTKNLNDYKREMVLLFIPFRNEEEDILAENKYVQLYDENQSLILERSKEFESNLNIAKTLEIIEQLGRSDEETEDDRSGVNFIHQNDPYLDLLQQDPQVNADFLYTALSRLGAVAKKRQNIMSNEDFCELMRMANKQQKDLLMHVISHLRTQDDSAIQIFFTGAAGCGKKFTVKLLMKIYNRFADTDGFCNAYINCDSIGKAAVAVDGITIHTALKIPLSRFLSLSNEMLQLYRSLFKFLKVLLIDEVSVVSAELLEKINSCLIQINGNKNAFGGLDIILIGDLRQLPPVKATPIFKQIRSKLTGTTF